MINWSEVGAIILPLVAFIGWFWNRIDNKFQKIDENFKNVHEEFKEVRSEIKEVRSEIKEVRDEVKELRTSLNRMEGAFYSKDCCILKEDKNIKKVE